MAIQVVTNTARAESYMRDVLAQGTTLARLVLNRVDFRLGTFRLPMPETIDQKQGLDLRSGNVRLAKDEEAAFAAVIRSFIRAGNAAVLMQELEASMSELSSGKLLAYRHLAVPYNDEVYWRVSGADLAMMSDDEMLNVMNNASYLPWTGFFYFDGISRTKRLISDMDLESVMTNLVGVAVSAFDYRSFLVWWRDDLVPFPL